MSLETPRRLAPDRLRRVLLRRVLLHRRALAALCAAGAVGFGVEAVHPDAAPVASVWTAARDVPGGAVLAAADLRRAAYPPATVPAHAASSADLLGRTLAAPVRSGQPLTDLSVVGRPLTTRYPGRTVVPTRVADPVAAALLRPGERVDVVAGDPSGNGTGRVVASDAVVVAVPRDDGGQAVDAPPGRLVLLAVDRAAATAVSAAGLAGYLGVQWVH